MGKNISKYRRAVMGFAILWIMVYHSGMSFSALPVFGAFLNNLRSNGFGGVDIFLFLSGFGLYRALSKKPGQLAFYKRRLMRVMPAYLPVLAVWLALRLPAVPVSSWPKAVLGNLTGTGFWLRTPPLFNWYMLALFSFYFIAPFFFRVIKKPGGAGWLIAATLVMDACFYGNYVMIAVTRFTIFAMGMALGRWEAEGKRISRPLELACYTLGFFSYWLLVILRASLSEDYLWNGGCYWYPFIFTAPAMIFLLCRIFSWIEPWAPPVLRMLEAAGECSLEIYLIHIVAFDYIHVPSNWLWPFVYAAMFLCGYIYHIAITKALAWRPGFPRLTERGGEAPLNRGPGGRKTYIEFLRIAACFLVIVNHTNSNIFLSLKPSPTWFCSLTYFFVCKIAVPLFLLIMGALLLRKEDPPKKTAERLLRILAVFLPGSLCYYVYYCHQKGAAFSLQEFLLRLPRLQHTNAFWYLYLYLALLCTLPILQRLSRALDRRRLEYLLFLSLGILGTAPLVTIFFPSLQLSGDFTAGLIGVYIGQVLLGDYIERYVPMEPRVFWPCLLGFVFSIAFQTAGTFLLYQRDPSSYLALDNRTLITITASAACFYICAKYIFTRHPPRPFLERAICRLGGLTFGIYLLSDMVLRQTPALHAALRSHMHPLAAVVLWELFIFAACALITAGLRLVPFLRKWL